MAMTGKWFPRMKFHPSVMAIAVPIRVWDGRVAERRK
jgi:hypothetical protein